MEPKVLFYVNFKKNQILFLFFFISSLLANAQIDTTGGVPVFTEQAGITLTGLMHTSAAWGDYDNDGNLDLIVTGVKGYGNTSPVTQIYRNNGNNTFSEQKNIALPGVYEGNASWGDYDNDGFLDILLVGNTGTDLNPNPISKIYHNNGNGTFTEQTNIVLKGVFQGKAAWGDYNNDGLLDIALMGTTGLEVVTKLYRNNGDNTFTDQTNIAFTQEYDGSIAWGDYDNDGNLDILICGYTGNSYATKLYRNNGNNTFTDQTTIALTNISSGTVAWGDYDNDGNLDILMSGFIGYTGVERVVKVYRNNGNNSFTELTGNSFPAIEKSTVAWGDYDNDGDLDILLTGEDAFSGMAKVFRNEGNDSFIEDTNASLPEMISGTAVWGDYDNDGKLDILVSGESNYTYVTKIYKNNTSVSNNGPLEISNLQTATNGSNVTFRWNKASDIETSQKGLTYDLYIYEDGQNTYKISPKAFKQTDSKNGNRIVAQIGGIRYNSNGYTVNGLPNGNYKWSVQAIDAGLKGGKFATEQSFTVGGIVYNLSVSLQAINLKASANSTDSFSITSNTSWQVNSNQSWLSVNSASGSNNATITVTAQVNPTTAIRTATITIAGTGVATQTITVTQIGAVSVMSMTTSKPVGSAFTFSLVANAANTPVQVDFGDGTLVSTVVGTSATIIDGTLVGSQTVKIYGSGITYLSCYNEQLTALDVSDNNSLSELNCSYNKLSSLDLTKNTALTYLHCGKNNLNVLDLSKNTALTVFKCYFNQFSSLDVSQNVALKIFDCSNNLLTSLDMAKNESLNYLYCSYNQLSALDITQNTRLTTLSCNNNHLTALDLSKNSVLSFLDCKFNSLSTLDVSGNAALNMVYCNNNQLVFNTLPLKQPSWSTYSYAPQSTIQISNSFEVGGMVDLSAHITVSGDSTVYTWKTKGGNALLKGKDYDISEGKTTFLKGYLDSIYCEMTNRKFPDFMGGNVFKTTYTLVKLRTGTEELMISGLEIYANQKMLYVNIPYSAKITVFDLSGRLVYSNTLESGNHIIPLQQTGIYLVKITGNKEFVSRKVFIE